MKTKPAQNLARDLAHANQKIMTPPNILTKDQKRIWRSVLSESLHVNTPAYRELLVVFVVAYDKFVKYSKLLEEQGPVIETFDGVIKANPLAAMVKGEASVVLSMSTKLSLTYRSRKNDVGRNEEPDRVLKDEAPKKRGAKPGGRIGPPALRIA